MFRRTNNQPNPMTNSVFQLWYLGMQDWYSPRPKYNSTTQMPVNLPAGSGGTTLSTRTTITSVNV